MKEKRIVYLVLLFLIFVGFNFVSADSRSYVWTYEYKTVEKGKVELETYYNISTQEKRMKKGSVTSGHQVELEVGMTDQFDFAVYQVFNQKPDEGLKHSGIKLRSRYKIGEKGKYFMDPLLYAEYKGNSDYSENVFEFKMIFAKDIGKFNIALNPVFELEKEEKWKMETEYAAGVSYAVSTLLRLGVEGKGGENGNYLGPVVSHGRDDLWFAFGSAFSVGKISEGEPNLSFRLLMGIGL